MTRPFASAAKQIGQRPWPLLVLLALVLYGPFLDNPLIFDDRLYLRPEIAEFPNALTSRWIHRLTLWFDATYLNLNFSHARLINVLIHAANAAILFQLVMTWGRIVGGNDSPRPMVVHTAFVSALLFCVHPAAVYAVGYLTQRSILLATMFGLLALLLHTKAQTTQKPAVFIGAAFCVFASMFSKEHSVMLPAFLIVLTWWLHRNGYPWHKGWTPVFAAYFSASLLTVYHVRLAPTSLYEPHTTNLAWLPEHPYLSSVLAQGLLFFKYVGFWLVPDPRSMSIDLHSDLPYQTLSWIGVLGLFATGGLLVAVFALIRCKDYYLSVIGLAGSYAFLMFATEFWVVRLSESFVIYRSYLWMPFVPFAAAAFLIRLTDRLTKSNAGLIVAVTSVSTLLLVGAHNRLDSMSSGLKAWSESVVRNSSVKNPAVARTYMNAGAYAVDEEQRLEYYRLALTANPNYGPAHVNLGYHYIMRDQLDHALESFAEAKKGNPGNTNARLGLAEVLQLVGRSEDALLEYDEILRIQPGDLRGKTDLGAAYIRLNRHQEAITLLDEVVANPRASDAAFFNLALAFARNGELERARQTIAAGLVVHPDAPLLLAYGSYLDERATRAQTGGRPWLPRVTRPPTGLS